MNVTRRGMIMRNSLPIIGLISLLFGLLGPSTEGRAGGEFRVTLLGTGTPTLDPDRSGPSTLVEAGDQYLLFDAGRGAAVRLWQLKVPLSKVDALFLTHYHSDHTTGIPDLWLTGWLPAPSGSRKTPFHVIGPPGAKSMMENLEKAYALDIKYRIASQKLSPEGVAVNVQEFDRDGVVYNKNGVQVIAFEVHHGDLKPAVGYRIEYNGHSVVLSGDTQYNENVIKYATGSDVLIHEVGMARPALMQVPSTPLIMAVHTLPKEAGMVFSMAKPKLAVYSHMVLLSSAIVPAPTPDDLIAETRLTYRGPLEVGEDLMSFEIGDTVIIHHFKQ